MAQKDYMKQSPYQNTLTGVAFAPIMPFMSYTLKFFRIIKKTITGDFT